MPEASDEASLDYQEVIVPEAFTLNPWDKQSSTDEPDITWGSIWDMDGDGQEEVLLGRSYYRPQERVEYRYMRVYRFDPMSGQLARRMDWPEEDVVGAVTDLDGDGLPDLVGWMGNRVHWGVMRDGALAYESTQMGYPDYLPTYFTFLDYDGNGLVDIVAALGCDHTGTKSKFLVFLQTSKREFKALKVGGPANVDSYAVLATRLLNGNTLLGAIGPNCDRGPAELPLYYQASSDGQMDPMQMSHIRLSTQAPMGATIADFDQDGEEEVVTLLNPSIPIVRQGKEVVGSYRISRSETGEPMIPWAAAALDLDLDGWTDLLIANGKDSFFDKRVDAIGEMGMVAFRNLGDPEVKDFGRFRSLGDPTIHKGQKRTLVAGDLNHDGKMDFVVGGFNENPRVYLSRVPGNGVTLRLIDAQGQTPYGCLVTIRTPARTIRKRVGSHIGSPWTVNEALVHAGLLDQTSAMVEVEWSAGRTGTYSVSAGTLTTIREVP